MTIKTVPNSIKVAVLLDAGGYFTTAEIAKSIGINTEFSTSLFALARRGIISIGEKRGKLNYWRALPGPITSSMAMQASLDTANARRVETRKATIEGCNTKDSAPFGLGGVWGVSVPNVCGTARIVRGVIGKFENEDSRGCA